VTPDFSILTAIGEDGYDLITAWGVLEHCAEPVDIIRRLYSLLRPGGTMAVNGSQSWGDWYEPYGRGSGLVPSSFHPYLALLTPWIASVAYFAAPTGEAKVSTRDCWDCNHLTDWLLNCALHLNDWQNRRMALRFDSLFRLFATLPNELVLNPFVFAYHQFGAELNLTLVKPTIENTISH